MQALTNVDQLLKSSEVFPALPMLEILLRYYSGDANAEAEMWRPVVSMLWTRPVLGKRWKSSLSSWSLLLLLPLSSCIGQLMETISLVIVIIHHHCHSSLSSPKSSSLSSWVFILLATLPSWIAMERLKFWRFKCTWNYFCDTHTNTHML